MTDSSKPTVEALKEKIRLLELENMDWTNRAEDIFLFASTAEGINDLTIESEIYETVLEKISIMKNFPYCAFGKLENGRFQIYSEYASFSEKTKVADITFSTKMIDRILKENIIIETYKSGNKFVDFKFYENYMPKSFIVISTSHLNNEKTILICANMDSLDKLDTIRNTLLHSVSLVNSKIDNLFLMNQLSEQNILLESKVEKRTRELEQRNNELIKSEKMYRSLFEKSSDAIFIVEKHSGKYLGCNKAAEKLTGRTFDEITKLNVKDICSQGAKNRLNRILNENESLDFDEVKYNRPDGSFRTALLSSIPLDEKHVFGIARDITEKKNLEEQLQQSQKLEGIGQLAGGIAHDFNNILSAHHGFTELALMKSDPNSKVHSLLLQIQKSNERATNLVRQILAFSRKQVFTPIILNINNTIQDLNKMLSRLIGEDIEISMKLSKEDLIINADPSQIEQIIINLFINARDAIKQNLDIKKEKKIILQTEFLKISKNQLSQNVNIQNGNYILLSIIDTGAGMDQETLNQIFEPFFTTKEIGQGTGLGLSTVFGIVKQNEGYIMAESIEKIGTTFKIYWPSTDNIIENVNEKNSIKNTYDGNETILYAEDDDILREVTILALSEQGYNVISCSNGEEAIRKAEELNYNFDILISDVMMPKMSGKELVEKVFDKAPDMKVILCSGYNEDMGLRTSYLNKTIPFIIKPFKTLDLSKKIRELMDE